MQWRGDEARLEQLCSLFHLASSPSNDVQRQVMDSLNQFSSLADFDMYLVTLFANMRDKPEIIRQRAGLLLKTNLGRAPHIPAQVAEYVLGQALSAVRDASKVIRHTAGTVITTIVNKVGVGSCCETLTKLADCLTDPCAEVVEGSFNALNKICEDGINTLNACWGSNYESNKPFVNWCTERLLPRVIEFASPSAPVYVRQNAIECLNHFALNYIFSDPQYPAFQPFAAKYVEVLGFLAQDSDVAVLRDVCKGFVCVIENQWECKSPEMAQVVLQYMLKASRHPEYAVRLEALGVWIPCTNSPIMMQLVQPMLPELVPVLLDNMVYSQADYMGMEQSQIDDDNAAIPDQAQDIKPRHHKEQNDEADDDDDGGRSGGAWGAEWTARKAAASSLDTMANAFRHGILQIVLPLIEQRLADSNWEVQESGVLALGAIAAGCLEHLVQFLPTVMGVLIRLCQAPKPLLRSISCWCLSRFSSWICHEASPNREQALRMVLAALLQRVVDRNKPVQEAACSALATLEEEARGQLTPYLPEIVQTLVQALEYYQAKNLLILYDAVGTLADGVGSELDKPEYVQALLTPLVQKFDAVADNDRSIIALFECLSQLARGLGPSFLPMVPRIVQRCVRLIMEGARAAQMWQQNPNEFEKPDRDVMAASIDLLAGIVEGLRERVGEVLAQQNFICVVPEVLKDTAMQVKQSAFALVGDCAKNCIDYLIPFLPEILPLCAHSLRANMSPSVSNNASWAIGEVCVKIGPEKMNPYIDDILQALIQVLQQPMHMKVLMQNICITLGRLGIVCELQVGKAFPQFAKTWCEVMRHVQWDSEKVNAYQGLCKMIKANPQGCMDCVPELAAAICSFQPSPPPVLEPSFKDVLQSYKQALGANWPLVHSRMEPSVQCWLQHLYSITV